MPIILNREDALKHDLLKQSLREQSDYKYSKNQSYSKQNDTFIRSRYSPRNFEQQMSDWNSNTVKDKQRNQQFLLPKMKSNRKSKNIQDLSRELLKYQQFSSNQNNQNNNFRLTILKQMTKINFKKEKEKPKLTQSPKKINIKLQFPQRYGKYQFQNQQSNNISPYRTSINDQTEVMTGSFYTKRLTQGLVPSIKKLISSSFPKKDMYRSQSERDSHQNKKLILNREAWQNLKINMADQIGQELIQTQRNSIEKKLKLARIERKLPINFLSYSHRKQCFEKDEQEIESKSKTKKSPHLIHYSLNSYESKINEDKNQHHENRRLSQCIFMNINKKKVVNR